VIVADVQGSEDIVPTFVCLPKRDRWSDVDVTGLDCPAEYVAARSRAWN
jgi:hypothetical protein